MENARTVKSLRTGAPVTLLEPLTRGGQGVIYTTPAPGVLAKIYSAQDDPERFEKLKVMIDYPPEDPTLAAMNHISIAWPQDLLIGGDGRCAGFLMPHIQKALELTHVYNPVFRAQRAPKFNWHYLHCAALNFVSAVQALHARKYVIGDIKPQNILVNPQALIALIDTDSFQVTSPRSGLRFRCPVGSEGFTPRELLAELSGRGFREVDRGEPHDRFGMAAIVYLLLFGRHPFMEGRWNGAGDPPGPDERVLRGMWLHLRGGEFSRDPGAIPLNVVHPEIEQCFRRCFIDGHHEPLMRPTAAEWRKALKTAVEDLAVCAAEPNHYYSRQNGECYWCHRRERLRFDIFSPLGRPPPEARAERHRPGVEIPPVQRGLPARRLPWLARAGVAVLAALFAAFSMHWFSQPDAAGGAAPPRMAVPPPQLPLAPPGKSDDEVLRELRLLYRARYDALIQSMKQPRGAEPAVPADPREAPAQPAGPAPVRQPPVSTGVEPGPSFNALGTLSESRGGYRYKILMSARAGAGAPFVMVAFPEKYSAGRKTYIAYLSKIYEKDLGPGTAETVEGMRDFKPDSSWHTEE